MIYQIVFLGSVAQSPLEVRAIEVTDNGIGNAPMLPGLLGQIPSDKPIVSASGQQCLREAGQTHLESLEQCYHRGSLVETKMHCLKRLGASRPPGIV